MRDTRYRKITSVLENRIRSGSYAPGAALPPRVELMAEFGVARATIDRCIGELRKKELVTSRHGSGTFVKEHAHHPYRVALIGTPDKAALHVPEAWIITNIAFHELEHKSDWPKLLQYDGLIWLRPEKREYPVIAFVHGNIPQIMVNRTIANELCISTDHRGAYQEITAERLARLPDSPVFLLRLVTPGLPGDYREAGFIDACRAAQRFYEVLDLPVAFNAKSAALEAALPPASAERPLLLVSTSLSNTGAIMRYAALHRLTWQKDIYYSDFDNDYSEEVWGVRVTSYLQDAADLLARAIEELQRVFDGETPLEQHTLLFPRRRHGDT